MTVGLPMLVEVALPGEPRVADTDQDESCSFRMDQDVDVTLSFGEPALDVVVETTASAFSSTFAVLQRELGSDVARAIGLPPRDVTLSLAFDTSGMKGTLDPHDECGFAVFPASVCCPDWSRIEVDMHANEPGTGFSLRVWRTPELPDRAAAEIRMLLLEQRDRRLTPPLDATIDPAGARCEVVGAR